MKGSNLWAYLWDTIEDDAFAAFAVRPEHYDLALYSRVACICAGGASAGNTIFFVAQNAKYRALYAWIAGGIGAVAGYLCSKSLVLESLSAAMYTTALSFSSVMSRIGGDNATVMGTVMSIIMAANIPIRVFGTIYAATYLGLNFLLKEKLGRCGVTAVAAAVGAIACGVNEWRRMKRKRMERTERERMEMTEMMRMGNDDAWDDLLQLICRNCGVTVRGKGA
jgi:peroxiredoxin family protein